MVKVIDKLLPDAFYGRLSNIFDDYENRFNWFWNSNTAASSNGEPWDNNFMFTHLLFHVTEESKSPWFETFFPIIYHLGEHIPIKSLYRMKLNLYTNQGGKVIHAIHTDLEDTRTKKPMENCDITILNFTTCNGGTIIGEEEYLSNRNQALIFDNKVKHQGFTQTDTTRRILLNIATSNQKV